MEALRTHRIAVFYYLFSPSVLSSLRWQLQMKLTRYLQEVES